MTESSSQQVIGPEEARPSEYWEKRLSSALTLGTVGDRRLGLAYNWWLYRARRRALNRSLKALSLDVRGKSVLDLGSGTGFYIDYWRRRGADSITGVDITDVSVRTLRHDFPDARFVRADIASDDLSQLGTFDVISAFDVLFHIADERGFGRAFENIRRCSREGTLIFLSDYFPDEDSALGPQESHRSYAHYREVCALTGLEEIRVSPVFHLMAEPLPGVHDPIVRFFWWFIRRILKSSRRLRLNTLFGHLIGLPLYLGDGVLTRMAESGPSTKLMVLRAANH